VIDPEMGIEPILEQTNTDNEDSKKTRSPYFVVALVLGLLITCAATYLVVYLLQLTRTNEDMYTNIAGENETTDISGMNLDFVGAKSTTGVDPYTPGSCDFGLNYTQPHVSQQCFCGGRIAVLAPDVREKYYALNMLLIEMKVSDVWKYPEESCDPRNQALVWLATTYARDRRDLVQKYVMASIYFTTKGEQWINNDLWLEHMDVCFWSGAECDDDGAVTGLKLDSNKLDGEVSTTNFVQKLIQIGRHFALTFSITSVFRFLVPNWPSLLTSRPCHSEIMRWLGLFLQVYSPFQVSWRLV
jgi:hypothetical protein